eukprot:2003672-Pleurochrysis_carterae.AAC.3
MPVYFPSIVTRTGTLRRGLRLERRSRMRGQRRAAGKQRRRGREPGRATPVTRIARPGLGRKWRTRRRLLPRGPARRRARWAGLLGAHQQLAGHRRRRGVADGIAQRRW